MQHLWSSSYALPAGTPAPSDLCRVFWQVARRTEEWLAEGQSLRVFPFETSVTDANLLELASALSGKVDVRPVPGREEKEVGADWLWDIRTDSGWVQMLVQAKIIDPASARYRQLPHRLIFDDSAQQGKPATFQTTQSNVLVAKSRALGIPAIYCFYSDAGRSWPNRPCTALNPAWGCAVAGAREIVAKVGIKVQPKVTQHVEIAKLCVPWTDLVCCPGGTEGLPSLAALRATITSLGETLGSPTPRPSGLTQLTGTLDGLAHLRDDWGLDGIVVVDSTGDSDLPPRVDRAETGRVGKVHKWDRRRPRWLTEGVDGHIAERPNQGQ